MSWPSWMSSAIRSSSWPTDPFSPPARWPSCGTAATSWRPTLSADSAARPADSRALETDGTAALRADGITAGYGGDPVIRNVGVRADAGTVVSVVGPNGSGKSTLLKAITGVLRLSAGQLRINGRDVTGLAPEEMARAGVGYVPQVDDVFGPLTVRENLEMGGYLLDRADIATRMDSVLAEHVRKLAEEGAAVLIVEQRARAVLAVSDHTYVMSGGELRMQGTPAELSDSPDFVRSFLGGRPGEDPPVSVRKGG